MSKYTKEILEEASITALSVSDVLRNLNLKVSGSNHRHISSRLKFHNVSIEHFNVEKSTKRTLNGKRRKTAEEILVFGKSADAKQLKRALKEKGREDICGHCGLTSEWNNKPITLQVDHKDGNRLNNLIDNLQILCPNCHTQTENYGIKNAKKINKPKNLCLECEKVIGSSAKYCKNCYFNKRKSSNKEMLHKGLNVKKTKIEWPSVENILERLKTTNYTALGRELGVSDNAIRKHLKLRMSV